MRPLTGTDIIDFRNSRYDLLVLTAAGEFSHIDGEGSAYDFIETDDGEAQILLEARAIAEGEWFPDALNDDGTLDISVADEMAAIITNDGILPSRALKAADAGTAWAESERTTNELAKARALAVAEVAAYAGSQTAAARILGLDQSTVNKLVRKANSPKPYTLISAAPGDDVPGHELGDPDCPEVPGLLDHPGVRVFLDLHGYGPDEPNELMYLITGTDGIPAGHPTFTVRL